MLDTLKIYLVDILGIRMENRTKTAEKEEAALRLVLEIKAGATNLPL